MMGHFIKIAAAFILLPLSVAWGADAKINGCRQAQITLAAEDLCRYLELTSTNPSESIAMLEMLKKHAQNTVTIEAEGVEYTFYILTYNQLTHYGSGALTTMAKMFQTLGPVTQKVSFGNALMMRVEEVSRRRFGRDYSPAFPWIETPLYAGKFISALAGGVLGLMSGAFSTIGLTHSAGFWVSFPVSMIGGFAGAAIGGAVSFYSVHFPTAVIYGIANRFLGALHHATRRYMRPSAQFIEQGIQQLAANPAKKYTALVVVNSEYIADDIAGELKKKHVPKPRLLPSP